MKMLSKLMTAILLLASVNASAIDLSQVSNAELLQELSARLGSSSGSGHASIISNCSGGNLKITLYGSNNDDSMSEYLGSNCNTTQASLQRKMGAFSGIRIFALCVGGNLKTVKAESIGKLSSTSDYAGSNCESQANIINGSSN